MSGEGRGRDQAFAASDWGLLAATALMWGSSFLLIEIGLEHLEPAVVAWSRVLFGALVLGCLPAARRPVVRGDWPLVALLGLVWMAGPFLLFAVAQQTIASSLAGMINGAAPLFTAAIAFGWTRRAPARMALVGLFVGFAGVLAINVPAAREGESTLLGAGLVLAATLLYGVAFNVAVPLEERNGALPVIWRAQLVALVALTPVAVAGADQSSFAWSSTVAVAVLGAFSTGLAFAAFVTLVGRVGAPRGSVTVYFIPVVAIVLGLVVREETVTTLAFVGTALVLLGAGLTSRRDTPDR